MNKRPIEQANDPDLRQSAEALRRAALRARELARKMGMSVIVSRGGKLEYLEQEEAVYRSSVHESTVSDGRAE